MKSLKKLVTIALVVFTVFSAQFVFAGVASLENDVAQLQQQVADLSQLVSDQQNVINGLLTQLATLNANDAVKLGALGYVKLDTGVVEGMAGPHVLFEGVNVHLRDGSGATESDVWDSEGNRISSGLGNLVIGYNEMQDEWGDPTTYDPNDRSGQHNLVMGRALKYTGAGNILQGWGSKAMGSFSSILAGDNSLITEGYSAIIAGNQNQVTDSTVVIIGGMENQASGQGAVVVGGRNNLLSTAQFCSIVGGRGNTVGGDPQVMGLTTGVTVLGGSFNRVENSIPGGNYDDISTLSGVSNVTTTTATSYVDGD